MALCSFGSFQLFQKSPAYVGSYNGSVQNQLTYNATKNVSSTALIVLTSKTGRLQADVCNDSTSTLAWTTIIPASYTTVTSTVGAANYFVAHSGSVIPLGGCYTIRQSNLLYGNVWAIRAGAGAEPIATQEVIAQ